MEEAEAGEEGVAAAVVVEVAEAVIHRLPRRHAPVGVAIHRATDVRHGTVAAVGRTAAEAQTPVAY